MISYTAKYLPGQLCGPKPKAKLLGLGMAACSVDFNQSLKFGYMHGALRHLATCLKFVLVSRSLAHFRKPKFLSFQDWVGKSMFLPKTFEIIWIHQSRFIEGSLSSIECEVGADWKYSAVWKWNRLQDLAHRTNCSRYTLADSRS